MNISRLFLLSSCLIYASSAAAHDTWVETNTNLIRTGDAIYVDLKLGNHGNEHRDFKLASKIDLAGCSLDVIDPQGQKYDLKPRLFDTGYAPNEGYWKGKFVPGKAGLHLVAHTLDKIVNHGRPLRSIKSAKTFFVVSPNLDRVSENHPDFDRVLGHPLEIIPTANPVTPMGPGQPIRVRVLFQGQPLPEARVSFCPRGEMLKEGFDEQFESMTDARGEASFTPKTGNHYLVVVHQRAEDERSDSYDATAYSATLTVFVPEVCPCCGS